MNFTDSLAGPAASDAPPHLSVVVPAFNEEATLADCLESIAGQDYRGRVEVIVVDNASTDATAEVAFRHGPRVVHEPVRGVCHARQAGTSAATGEIVVSSDADTRYPPDWLSKIATTMDADPGLVATCGPCWFVDGPRWSGWYTRLLFGFTAWFFRATGRVLYASATNIAFRRSAWTGYNLTLTQGGDELGLLRSLRRRGPVHFAQDQVSLTSSRRLTRGFVYSVVVTCFYFYLCGYMINRITGRQVLGSAPAIRAGSGPVSATKGRRLTAVTAVALAGVVALGLRFAQVDVV